MTDNWPALAADYPDLAHIPPALRHAARVRVFAAGETVFRQGDRPKAMFRVLEGEVRLLRRSRDGAETVLQRSRAATLPKPAWMPVPITAMPWLPWKAAC